MMNILRNRWICLYSAGFSSWCEPRSREGPLLTDPLGRILLFDEDKKPGRRVRAHRTT